MRGKSAIVFHNKNKHSAKELIEMKDIAKKLDKELLNRLQALVKLDYDEF